MICKHDTHANSFSISHASPLLPPAFSLVSIWYNSPFPATLVPFPLLQLAVNTNPTNRGRRQLLNITSCYYTDILTFGPLSVVAPCAHSLPQRSTSLCLSYHLSRHFLKSCAAAIPSVSFVFVAPKVSPIRNDLFTLILTWAGVVRLIPYPGGVGCGSGVY